MPIKISDVSKTHDPWPGFKEYDLIDYVYDKASAIKLARKFSGMRKHVIVTRNQERGWWGVYVKKS